MADILKGLFGGASKAAPPLPSDADFADFATAASPLAPSHEASTAFSGATTTPAAKAAAGLFGSTGFAGVQGRPYTKWYRVWERTTRADFYQELVILPFIFIIILLNALGTWYNNKYANQWAKTYLPVLEGEFASVGFGKGLTTDKDASPTQATGVPEDFLRQKAKNEYITYATGRQNIASLELKLTLYKRYNPALWIMETVLSFFVDSISAPVEKLEATAHCFDGKEKALVPQGQLQGNRDSSYDNFVFAVVHKDQMKKLRDERYDLSLTTTRDHAKLPDWATTMSESAEITEAMLTPELVKAVNDIGEDLEALIVTDQPIDAPKKINDTISKKRVSISTKLNPKSTSTSFFQYFLRLPDQLVANAHYRPEALRKVRATREDEARKIRRVDEEEKAEERRLAGDKMKKEERDRKLSRMSAEEQKKFLDKEREKDKKKGMKKQTMRSG